MAQPKQLKGVGGVLGNLLTSSEQMAAADQEMAAATEEKKQVESQGASRVHVEEPVELGPTEPREAKVVREPESRRKEEVKAPSETVVGKQKARLGRPPAGTAVAEPVEREKVSLRLRADLAATYRDWSWEEHCQFSDLVDRALEHYLKSRGKGRKP
jgi:hypothetical protein